MPKKAAPNRKVDPKLKEVLASTGVEPEFLQTLLASSRLDRAVIPIYSKSTVSKAPRNFWLVKLPQFLKWFQDEFPNGEARWNPDYEDGPPGSGEFAIQVTFNLQEDDQGARRAIRPGGLEEELYDEHLERFEYRGKDAVPVHEILHGR